MANNPISTIDPDGCPCSVCPENCQGSGADAATDADPMFPGTSGLQQLDPVTVTNGSSLFETPSYTADGVYGYYGYDYSMTTEQYDAKYGKEARLNYTNEQYEAWDRARDQEHLRINAYINLRDLLAKLKHMALGFSAIEDYMYVAPFTGLSRFGTTISTYKSFSYKPRFVGSAAKTGTQGVNRIYSSRELIRRAEEPGPFHNFPEVFNKTIFQNGTKTITPNYFNVAKSGLSNTNILYKYPGTVNGTKGFFEIGVRPSVSSRTEVIMHRFFNPTR